MPNHDDRSTAELLRGLLDDVRMLVREEIALVRAEAREAFRHAGMTVAAALVSAAMLGVGGLWLLIAFTRAIAHAFGWSEAIVYAGVGALLAVGGVALAVAVAYRVKGIRVLPRTREVLAANGHWRSRRTADGPDARW